VAKLSKRISEVKALVSKTQLYNLEEAVDLIKKTATAKFKESVDISIQLGIDAKKSDQTVRGALVLPEGTGKNVRVAVFAQGEKAEEAKLAGADVVGMDDLASDIKSGKIDFDLLIATPDTMRVVGALGQVLGPRGLMPNPKVGTVTTDVSKAVKDGKSGQIQFRTDKSGIVHCSVGKAEFSSDRLTANIKALVDAFE